ncbi:MAG: trimethylamine methyltransferase family protein, partial [Gammaproteobacteria bacterium]|nr:trimethylamine methyltransferase family protein [Gammaproteobacteria bacterium]
MRPTLNVLSEDLISKVLGEAKRIMAETGMEIRGENMRQRMLDHGLKTDASGKRILFPADVVDAAIASTPKSFTLYNRDGEAHAEIGGYNVHYVPGSSGLKIQDHRTGETRLSNSTDFIEYARLCDGLEHIAYLATAFSTNEDIESQVSDAWRLYMTLTTSKKPVVTGAFSEHGVPRMVEMQQLFRSDRAELIEKPMSIFTITATGNFRYGEDSCQNMLDCVEAGIPIEIVPVTLMGLIAPVTLVGALVFHCVDVLTGLTMAQIIRPGTPVIFGGAPATFHMKAASSPMAAIEAQHLNVAYVAVAKSLDLPTQAYMALSDGKFLDAQGGGETFSSALLAALAGVNSVSGPGMLDFVLTFSLPKLVFDNEVCGQCLHFVKELRPLDDLPTDDLVAQLLREDHLITAPHTLQHWPQELYQTDPVIDRANRETWEET